MKKLFTHVGLLAFMLFTTIFFNVSSLSAQSTDANSTVYTDKTDYYPGETVIIQGDGWEPGEQVKLEIDHSTISHGNTVLYATADDNGHINNEEFIIQPLHLGEYFTLTATGLNSGLTAENWFTDAAKTWVGAGTIGGTSSADFNTASNWRPSGVPGSTDDITIEISGGTTIAFSDNATVNSLTFRNRSGSGTTATLNLGAKNLTVTNNLRIDGNGGTADVKIGTGTVSISGSITTGSTGPGSSGTHAITFTDAGNLNLSGNAQADMTFTPATSTVNFNGTGTQTIRAATYYNLTLSNTGTKTLNNNITVSGSFSMSNGVFNMVAVAKRRTMDIDGNFNMTRWCIKYGNVSSHSYIRYNNGGR
jgi:hypothetical protein